MKLIRTIAVMTVLLLGIGSRAAEAAPLRLLICQPGGPTLVKEHADIVEKMYRYLENKTGLKPGQIEGQYLNRYADCTKALTENPAILFPSLPFYLEHARGLGLDPIAQLMVGGTSEDAHYVMVAKDSSFSSLKDLAGKKLTGTTVASKRFVAQLVMAPQPLNGIALVPSKAGLRAIRSVLKGKADAVLLDGTQFRALARTRYGQKLRLLHKTEILPNAPIAVVPGRIPKGYSEKLGRALVEMAKSPEGAELTKLFQIEGFIPADRVGLSKVQAKFDRPLAGR